MAEPKTKIITDKEPILKEMQKFVGGYIQVVTSVNGNEDIVINEEGKMKGLPMNMVATTFYLGEDWDAPTSALVHDVLVGNAMVLKGKARLS